MTVASVPTVPWDLVIKDEGVESRLAPDRCDKYPVFEYLLGWSYLEACSEYYSAYRGIGYELIECCRARTGSNLVCWTYLARKQLRNY